MQHLRIDNEGFNTGNKVQDMLNERGIQREPSAPFTPSQNVVVKRTSRTIVEEIQSMIHGLVSPSQNGLGQLRPNFTCRRSHLRRYTAKRLHMKLGIDHRPVCYA